MLIRRETPDDVPAVQALTGEAFASADRPVPVEVTLLAELRKSAAWLPELSLVAVDADGESVIGHVVCTRAHAGGTPVVGLGPLSVAPEHQRKGVGLALVHTALGAADALGEPLVALLGSPDYYGRYGFRASTDYRITPPDPAWGPYFQVRPLSGYTPSVSGAFRYAEPFDRV
ncbi:GNAT family N-acetyltransferase [Actinacidiphila glaucinigra]|uniref:Putative acetyltransferase n=1 Tax=Actinacidiphila glaucinigra TaxID=235986 RepID=A0A239BKX7_9ACTN|nr:N-acetyltransferase [Actinacidiphila glaucinigra]SNS08805.1 putative acetyltransferase [Actinacidiphila glaucinigra]